MGITIENAQQLMEELFEEKTRVNKQYNDLADKRTADKPTGIRIDSLEMTGLRQQSERIDKSLTTLREWWALHVLEGVEEESRRLKWLTIVLIALTTVLTIFTGFLVSGIRIP